MTWADIISQLFAVVILMAGAFVFALVWTGDGS
jgi:hypothetical protein